MRIEKKILKFYPIKVCRHKEAQIHINRKVLMRQNPKTRNNKMAKRPLHNENSKNMP